MNVHVCRQQQIASGNRLMLAYLDDSRVYGNETLHTCVPNDYHCHDNITCS